MQRHHTSLFEDMINKYFYLESTCHFIGWKWLSCTKVQMDIYVQDLFLLLTCSVSWIGSSWLIRCSCSGLITICQVLHLGILLISLMAICQVLHSGIIFCFFAYGKCILLPLVGLVLQDGKLISLLPTSAKIFSNHNIF